MEGMNPEAQLHQNFFNWIKASGILKVAREVKKGKGKLDVIFVPGDIHETCFSHGEWFIGKPVREFFYQVIKNNENLPVEVQELCKTYINNWIQAVNIALAENPEEEPQKS